MSEEQTSRWFGFPWPSAAEPAPVCEEWKYRIDTPIGRPCAGCAVEFDVTSSGVAIPGFDFEAGTPPRIIFPWSYFHVRCFLATVIGEPMATSLTKEW